MLGIDYVGFIGLVYLIIRIVYILLMVDYFTKFI